jgi:hypothetical protein
MGEAAMYVLIGVEQVDDGERTDDGGEQNPLGEFPCAPDRRHVRRLKQVLRGKIPGIPG